ncbi:GL19740 [Drosophila persimilis]|uniref:GL19740 n=1 Tax=Drosophila persimilis TaxID=7234 RepID=B4HB42_DROPE|nr:uncharacterized protein LOC6603049 isoform X2 [Drosophila persimilis]EDW37845.1 GL19740 [Drosophila persimilis]
MPAVAAGMAGGRPCAPPASEDRTAINSVLRATISNAKEAPSPTLLSISPPTHGPRATRRRRRGSDADGRTLIYNLQIKETKDLEFHMRCAEHTCYRWDLRYTYATWDQDVGSRKNQLSWRCLRGSAWRLWESSLYQPPACFDRAPIAFRAIGLSELSASRQIFELAEKKTIIEEYLAKG